MKIEKTPSNITSLVDYKKTKKGSKPKSETASAPARIMDFEVLSSLHQQRQPKMSKDEVRQILDPDGYTASKQQTNKETANLSLNAPVVDFSVLSSLYPNIKKSDESELVEFFLMEGYSLTYEQAAHAIEKYKQDAIEAYPKFEKVKQIAKEFEDRIKKLDFSGFGNVANMYEKKDKLEMIAQGEMPDTFIPSKESSRVTQNIARLYVDALKKAMPDYDIAIEDDNDPTNNTTQISIATKNNDILLFYYEDFLSTLKKGKVSPNTKFIISTPPSDKHEWHYDGAEGIMCKVNKIFSGAIGAVSKDSYNEKGEPEFYIDAGFDAGPTYYGLVETLKIPKEEKRKANIDETGNMTEEEINLVKDMVSKDPEINKYYKEYGLLFVKSCLRDGQFNFGIAIAQSLLLELGEYLSMHGEISLDYIEKIISHVEEEGHYIDEDVFEIANSFLIKELNSKEDHHELVYSVLDYVRTHQSERTFDFADNLADEMFNFEEVKSVMDLLKSSSPKKQVVIMQKLNKLVRKFDESEALKPDVRMFDQLMHELHLD